MMTVYHAFCSTCDWEHYCYSKAESDTAASEHEDTRGHQVEVEEGPDEEVEGWYDGYDLAKDLEDGI
jgi:hypothetical protein